MDAAGIAAAAIKAAVNAKAVTRRGPRAKATDIPTASTEASSVMMARANLAAAASAAGVDATVAEIAVATEAAIIPVPKASKAAARFNRSPR